MAWYDSLVDLVYQGEGDPNPGVQWKNVVPMVGGIAALLGGSDSTSAGYQGSVPELSAVRAQVPNTYDPNRRPGSGGQRYFSDTSFVAPADRDAAMQLAAAQAQGIAGVNAVNPARQARPSMQGMSDQQIRDYFGGILSNPNLNTERKQIDQSVGAMNQYNVSPERLSTVMDVPLTDIKRMMSPTYTPYGEATPGTGGVSQIQGTLDSLIEQSKLRPYGMAAGGIASVPHKGYYLGGATDGMADEIPANIDGVEQAALSDGEFVIPADVVSGLGNGNSNAGANVLHNMMDRIRKARTGQTEQGRQIAPEKFIPA